MIQMKCLKELVYAARRLRPGDCFDAKGSGDAKLLAAIGKAERVVRVDPVYIAPPVPSKKIAKVAKVIADSVVEESKTEEEQESIQGQEPAQIDAPQDDMEKPKRQYRRRDMTAESND